MRIRSNSETDLHNLKTSIDDLNKLIHPISACIKNKSRLNLVKKATKKQRRVFRSPFSQLFRSNQIINEIMIGKIKQIKTFTVDVDLVTIIRKYLTPLIEQLSKSNDDRDMLKLLKFFKECLQDIIDIKPQNLDLMIKNVLINRLNCIFLHLNKKLDLSEKSKKILGVVNFIFVSCMNSLTKVSYYIDYYNIFINYQFELLKIKINSLLRTITKDILCASNLLYKVAGALFKLMDSLLKDKDDDFVKYTMSNISTRLHSSGCFFFNNFYRLFLKDDSLLSDSPCKFHLPHFSSRKLVMKNSPLKINIVDLILYLNLKLIKWKEMLWKAELTNVIRCRICEIELNAKDLAMHSFTCLHKQEWKDDIIRVNKDLKDCIDIVHNVPDLPDERNKNEKICPSTLKNILIKICDVHSKVKLSSNGRFNKNEYSEIHRLLAKLCVIQQNISIPNQNMTDYHYAVSLVMLFLMNKLRIYESLFLYVTRLTKNGVNKDFMYTLKINKNLSGKSVNKMYDFPDECSSIKSVQEYKSEIKKALSIMNSHGAKKNCKGPKLRTAMSFSLIKKRLNEITNEDAKIKVSSSISLNKFIMKKDNEKTSGSCESRTSQNSIMLSSFTDYLKLNNRSPDSLSENESKNENVSLAGSDSYCEEIVEEMSPVSLLRKNLRPIKKSKFFKEEDKQINALSIKKNNNQGFKLENVSLLPIFEQVSNMFLDIETNTPKTLKSPRVQPHSSLHVNNFQTNPSSTKEHNVIINDASSSSDSDSSEDLRTDKDILNRMNNYLTNFGEQIKNGLNSEMPNTSNHRNININDFEIIDVLSEGGYGKVFLGKKRNTGDIYAIKKINKNYLKQKNLYQFVENEMTILNNTCHDYVVKCYYSFSDKDFIYFVMEYLNGGDFSFILSKFKGIGEVYVKQYVAEILQALEYLHDNNIIHRDLKPENIMLDGTGHIKLTDFGLSDQNIFNKYKEDISQPHEGKVYGTLSYLSPELLNGCPSGKEADYWALGVIIYELLIGDNPFYSEDQGQLIENIKTVSIRWPKISDDLRDKESYISTNAYEIVSKLLEPDPKKRLGSDGIRKIKEMAFFKDIDWGNLKKQKFLFTPKKESRLKSIYFDKTRIKEETNENNTESSYEDESEESPDEPFRRNDLLHKKNLEYFNDKFKLNKISDLLKLTTYNIIQDLNCEDF